MDRSTEPHNSPGNPTQSSGPVSTEDSHQEPSQSPPQASSFQPLYQPVPTLALNAPQTASNTTGVGPRGPPTPAKSEADRAFRASRPISSPTSQDHQADAPAGLTNPPREQPPRRGSTLPPRASSVIPGREGYNENGAYKLMEPALTVPPPTRRHGAALDWVIGSGSEKHAPYVVSAALLF